MRLINSVISSVREQWKAIRQMRLIKSAISVGRAYWQTIRDHRVAEEILRTRIDIKSLKEEGKDLKEQRRFRIQEIATLQTPEIVARHKLRQGNAQACVFVFLAFSILGSAYWTLNYTGWEWWKQALVATGFLALAICIERYIRQSRKVVAQVHLDQQLLIWSLVAVLAGCTGVAFFHMARGISNQALHPEVETAPVSETADEIIKVEEANLKKRQWNIRVFDGLIVLALILFGIAAEIAAGLTYLEASENRHRAKSTLEPYAKLRAITAALVRNAKAIEAAKQRPGILYHRLTAEGLAREAEEARMEEAKSRQEARRRAVEEKREVLKAERSADIGWAMRKVALVFFLVLIIGTFIAVVVAAETHVLGIDRSTSAGVHEEFEFRENLKTAGEVLRNISGAGSRAVVIGIHEQSFGAPVILDRTAPTDVGRFGERLSSWRLQTFKEWEIKKKTLKPIEKGTDIFGFFARVSVIFANDPNETKRLVVLSDMRQVGRGYNFERIIDDPVSRVKKINQEGLIPDLSGVQVWVLGAHTAGMDERLWRKLREFWTQYLKKAGAELKAFSPDRRFSGK
jgi:hypothetical protein